MPRASGCAGRSRWRWPAERWRARSRLRSGKRIRRQEPRRSSRLPESRAEAPAEGSAVPGGCRGGTGRGDNGSCGRGSRRPEEAPPAEAQQAEAPPAEEPAAELRRGAVPPTLRSEETATDQTPYYDPVAGNANLDSPAAQEALGIDRRRAGPAGRWRRRGLCWRRWLLVAARASRQPPKGRPVRQLRKTPHRPELISLSSRSTNRSILANRCRPLWVRMSPAIPHPDDSEASRNRRR